MKFEQLPTDLQTWLRDMIGRNSTRESVLQALLKAGYTRRHADDAVEAAWRVVPAPSVAVVERREQPTTVASKEIETFSGQLSKTPNAFATSDREVVMLVALAAPRVILFGNLLGDDECDALVALSRDKLERSSVVNATTGQYDVHPHRTSSGTHFARGENELIQRIERRISELVQYPVERGEPLQILHYQPGGEYRPHYDYFDPKQPGNEQVLAQGGQRIATLIMYLNNVEAGGSTVFPQAGLDVLPRKGNAVYFAYTTEQGELDSRSLHGGSPVASGEKWIATKWFREQTYGGPGA